MTEYRYSYSYDTVGLAWLNDDPLRLAQSVWLSLKYAKDKAHHRSEGVGWWSYEDERTEHARDTIYEHYHVDIDAYDWMADSYIRRHDPTEHMFVQFHRIEEERCVLVIVFYMYESNE